MSDILRRRQIARQKAAVQAQAASPKPVTADEADAEFQRNHVQLKSGEWITRSDFNSLNNEEQTVVMAGGLTGLNKYLTDKANEQAQIEYDKAKKQYDEDLANFENTHIKLESGEYVKRTEYLALPKYLQNELMKRGVSGFNTLLQNTEELAKIQPATPENPPAVLLATSGAMLVQGEYAGPPTTLGGTYGFTPETLAREKELGGYIVYNVDEDGSKRVASAEEAKEFTAQIVDRMTDVEKTRFDKEIGKIKAGIIEKPQEAFGGSPLMLERKGTVTEAIYAGPSSQEGGTWGKTPETLARQVSGMGEYVEYYVTPKDGERRKANTAEAAEMLKKAVAKLSEEEKKRYDQEIANVKAYGKDISKWPEWLKKPTDYLVLPNKVISLKDKNAVIAALQTQGVLPEGAKLEYAKYDDKGRLQVKYSIPERRSPEQIFSELKESGQIPNNAEYTGATLEETGGYTIKYKTRGSTVAKAKGGAAIEKVSKKQDYTFKSMFTEQQAKELAGIALAGGAVAIIPEGGGVDIPIEAAILGVILAGVAGKALFDNREALVHNAGVLQQMAADKMAEGQSAVSSFANAVWVDAQGQINAFDERAQQWIESVLKPSLEGIPLKEIEAQITGGFPLEKTEALLLRNLQFIPDTTLPGFNLTMPKIEDYILVNPNNKTQVAAKDLMMSVIKSSIPLWAGIDSAQRLAKYAEYEGSREQMWDLLNQATESLRQANIERSKQAIADVAKMIERMPEKASAEVSILQKHALANLREAEKKMAALLEASKTYVQSLNPSPLAGGSLDKKAVSGAAAAWLAANSGTAKKDETLSGHISKVIMDNHSVTEPYGEPITDADTYTKALVSVTTDLMEGTGLLTQTATQAQKQALVRVAVQTVAPSIPHALTNVQVKTAIKAATQTMTQVETATTTATKTATRTKSATKTATGELTTDIPGGGFEIPPKVKKYEDLTSEQRKGIVAWKQGLFYKIWYPPYLDGYVINTTEPVPGVKYYEGVGSAAKSIVALRGEIPKHMRLDMGIQDVNVFRGKDPRKPIIRFTADVKQKTKYTGVVKEKVKKGRK